jgi:hypothetical protein
LRLDWVVPCRYAESPGDGTLTILGGGTDTFWIEDEALPLPFAVFLAMRVVGPEDEWTGDEEYTLSVRLVRPDVEEESLIGPFPLRMEQIPPLKEPGAEAGMVIPAAMTWEAREFGLYTLEVYIGERRQKSVAISVRRSSELTQSDESEEG